MSDEKTLTTITRKQAIFSDCCLKMKSSGYSATSWRRGNPVRTWQASGMTVATAFMYGW